MYCPHCKRNSLLHALDKLSSSEEKVFICKNCNEKSYVLNQKIYEKNPLGYTFVSILFIGSFTVSSPLNIIMIIVSMIIAISMMSNKDAIAFKSEENNK